MSEQATIGEARPAAEATCILGESPLWDWREGRLWWVDVRAPALWRLDPGTDATACWPMPEIITAVMLRTSGGLVLGLASGLWAFDPGTERLERLVARDEPHEGNRVNDCKVDRSGAIWWSSMWDFGARTTGALYRLAPDGALNVIRRDVTIPNGLCFSPGGRRGWFADTAADRIESFALAADGTVSDWREFGPGGLPGRPDGATCDAAGRVWSARYGGGVVACHAPTGEVERLVRLPVSQPSSCAFGGPDLATLFVTTSRQRLPPGAAEREPLAGRLLQIETGARGLPEPAFGG